MKKPIPWKRLIGYLVIYKLLFWNIAVVSLPVLPLNRDSFELHLSYPLEGETSSGPQVPFHKAYGNSLHRNLDICVGSYF